MRGRWWRWAAGLGLVLLVAACASRGPVSNPIARNLTWYSYVAGDDIRAACFPRTPNQYRLVYNARYLEQVRTYDIVSTPIKGGAVMEVQVKRPAKVDSLVIFAPLTPWRPIEGRQFLRDDEFQAIEQALEVSGVFDDPPPIGLELPSGTFYWVITGCRDGRFVFNAYRYPSPRYERLSFIGLLAHFDPTGEPFNPPRPLPRRARLPIECTSRRDPPPECLFPPFLFTVGPDGLVEGPRI